MCEFGDLRCLNQGINLDKVSKLLLSAALYLIEAKWLGTMQPYRGES